MSNIFVLPRDDRALLLEHYRAEEKALAISRWQAFRVPASTTPARRILSTAGQVCGQPSLTELGSKQQKDGAAIVSATRSVEEECIRERTAGSTPSALQALKDHLDNQWAEAARLRRLQSASSRELPQRIISATRTSITVAATRLTPLSKLEFLRALETEGAARSSDVRSASDPASATIVVQPSSASLPLSKDSATKAIDDHRNTLQAFRLSDELLRFVHSKFLRTVNITHPLPYLWPNDFAVRMVETHAAQFCVPRHEMHLFACFVYLLLEAEVQLNSFQSAVELRSHVLRSSSDAGASGGQGDDSLSEGGLGDIVKKGTPADGAFRTVRLRWLEQRLATASPQFPRGVALVVLTTKTLEVAGTTEDVFVSTTGKPSMVASPARDAPAAANDEDGVLAMRAWLLQLFSYYPTELLAAPSWMVQRMLQDYSSGIGGGGSTACPPSPTVPRPLLLRPEAQSLQVLASATGADFADALCYLGRDLVATPGIASASDRVELTGAARHTLESYLELRQSRRLQAALRISPVTLWYLQRCTTINRFRCEEILAEASRDTSGHAPWRGGRDLPCAGQLELRVLHQNQQTSTLGTPRQLVRDCASSSGTTQHLPSTTEEDTVGHWANVNLLNASQRLDAAAVHHCLLVQEKELNRVPLEVLTPVDVERYVSRLVELGRRMRRQNHSSAAPAAVSLHRVNTGGLEQLGSEWILPLPPSTTAGTLSVVLQCNPSYRYIIGCGAQSMFVAESGDLGVRLQCHRFVKWDYRVSFTHATTGATTSEGASTRGSGSARAAAAVRTLRRPNEVVRCVCEMPLPKGVERYSWVSRDAVLDMVSELRGELAELTLSSPDHVAAVEGKLLVTDEVERTILHYVLRHHPQYFHRRGCGLDQLCVTLNPPRWRRHDALTTAAATTAAAAPPHPLSASEWSQPNARPGGTPPPAPAAESSSSFSTDGGHLLVVRNCGTMVDFHIAECYDDSGTLHLPWKIADIARPLLGPAQTLTTAAAAAGGNSGASKRYRE